MPPHISRPPGGREFVVPPLFNSADLFEYLSLEAYLGKGYKRRGGKVRSGSWEGNLYIYNVVTSTQQAAGQSGSQHSTVSTQLAQRGDRHKMHKKQRQEGGPTY